MAARILAVIERDTSGAAPAQYNDLLFFCVGLRVQFGSVDVVLRGSAAACALEAQAAPGSADGEATTGKDGLGPHRYLRTLISAGATVWAEEADLAGPPGTAALDGVAVVDTDTLASRWHEYREVWFL
jgi:hypothetical protein